MRARRAFRPSVEPMSARIAPSTMILFGAPAPVPAPGGLVPYGNPVLAPVTIRVETPASTPHPLDPTPMPDPEPYDEPFVGDGTPPPFGELPPPLYA